MFRHQRRRLELLEAQLGIAKDRLSDPEKLVSMGINVPDDRLFEILFRLHRSSSDSCGCMKVEPRAYQGSPPPVYRAFGSAFRSPGRRDILRDACDLQRAAAVSY